MPALQNNASLSSSLGSCGSSISASEILQKHSINSLLLDQNDILPGECETMSSISDLLGLNSPRGLLYFGNNSHSSGLCTPTSAYSNYQFNFDDAKYYSTPSKHSSMQSLEKPHLERLSSFVGSNNTRALRSTSMSDSCGCSSPVVGDRSYLRSNTRSDSPESDRSNVSSPADENLAEILNSLTLNNDSLGRNQMHQNNNNCGSSAAMKSELDLSFQNLQAIQALKYSMLGAFAPSSAACSHKQILDKWTENQHSSLFNVLSSDVLHLDKATRYRRSTASLYDAATCTWSGVLPSRSSKPTGYSCKVFLGGVPWDITEQILVQTFRQFGPIRVEWPGKEKQSSHPKGYVYIIFESEKNVRALLQACTTNHSSGNWYFKVSSKRMKAKEVQVIPWILNDSSFTKSTSQKLDPSKSVFVGALHGVLNAEGLAKIMNDLFDGVVYAGIDTDKYKYPIGSGRITFDNNRSYMKAVAAAYVEIKTEKFTKKIQVDPYLEDSLCSLCGVQQGPYFCRDVLCYRYLCRTCWQWQHDNMELRHHKPLTRNSKNSTVLGLNNNSNNNNSSRVGR